MNGAQNGHHERRFARRYPVRLPLIYSAGAPTTVGGSGAIVDISSTGVLFTTDRPLEVGQRVQIAAEWPAILDGTCRLRLVIHGHVVRSCRDHAAVSIGRHEFRTRAGAPTPADQPFDGSVRAFRALVG